jgi:D-arginine dehydrogenase
MRPEAARYAIIGAGFAGAATACHLALQGARQIVIVEQEAVAGFHSSGRNAGFIRQVLAEPSVADLAAQSAEFIRKPPPGWPVPVSYNAIGCLILGRGEQWDGLQQDAELARRRGLDVECWSPEKTRAAMPLIEGAALDGAVWCASDGVVDINALLSGYLKMAQSGGAAIRYGAAVEEVRVRNGRVQGIATSQGFVEADVVVNAAGPWVGPVGAMAGAAPIAFHPRRRHLFVTPPLDWVKPDWPFVLNVSDEVYFQPSSGGLMLCPCDEDELPPCDPPTRPEALELLAERLAAVHPDFPDVPIARYWAGLRTFSDDNRFVIGWDTKVEGFFWVAGLAGHGVTTSAAVGSLAARLLFGADADPNFSPARFG